jgi:hypothetical protein
LANWAIWPPQAHRAERDSSFSSSSRMGSRLARRDRFLPCRTEAGVEAVRGVRPARSEHFGQTRAKPGASVPESGISKEVRFFGIFDLHQMRSSVR